MSVSYILAANVEKLELQGSADIDGTGNTLNNTLVGNAGNNRLDGGAGNDTLTGGAGNDTYVVDAAADLVIEAAGGGIDTIESLLTRTLPAEIENLTLLGTGSIDGTGNAFDNLIIGNPGRNVLTGLGGNDRLESRGGPDLLAGGTGDDTYVILGFVTQGNTASESVIESPGEGIDTVLTVDWKTGVPLFANVENLIRTVGLDGELRGNELANRIIGNTGADRLYGGGGADYLEGGYNGDRLDGGPGADTMVGGPDGDAYFIDDPGDTIVEDAAYGYDRVTSSISFTLPDYVEELTLTGTADIDAVGNDLPNSLTGTIGRNTLDGRGGNDLLEGSDGIDTLIGGTGDDTYVIGGWKDDIIVELPGEGFDTVMVGVGYTLPPNVEAAIFRAGLTIFGNELDNVFQEAGDLASIVDGAGGNDVIHASGGDDTLRGQAGDDWLDGGAGADVMQGGPGDDRYSVDSAGDSVIELEGEGVDTVESAMSQILGNHVENLTLLGSASIDGTGNDLANVIVGNSAANRLDGGAGADVLRGGAGDDTYTVDSAGDSVIEDPGAGFDTVTASVSHTLEENVERLILAGTANLTGTGNDLDNTFESISGVHVFAGGAGNDTYVVADASTSIIELPGQGVDTVISSVDLLLPAEVEILRLTGTAVTGTGNTLGNTIIGNAAANVLSGGEGDDVLDGAAGADLLVGGPGSDVHIVDDVLDVVVETAGQGLDTVRSSVSFTLSAEVERLELTGSTVINATGNDLANTLTGNSASNVLTGGDGADSLIGNAGDDRLVFDALDVLVDGGDGDDTAVFAGAGMDYSASSPLFRSIERFDLTGTGANRLTLTAQDVVSVSDSNGLVIHGDADDVVTGSAGWRFGGMAFWQGTNYLTLSQGEAYLLIDARMTVDLGLGLIDLAQLDGSDGFRLNGIDAGDAAGWSVSGAGDVNADGYADIVIGADRATNDGAAFGEAYVVFGRPDRSGAEFDLGSLDGSNGFRLDGIDGHDGTGWASAGAGDLNGDGYADVAVSARGALAGAGARAGETFAVFGGGAGFAPNLDLALLDGSDGVRLDGIAAGDRSGTSIASAGDFNGDGYADLAIGAPQAAPGGLLTAGEAYVVYGAAGGYPPSAFLGAVNGSNGIRVAGPAANNRLGFSVGSAGDFNGDGYADVAIGAPGDASGAGAAYVIFGSPGSFPSVVDPTALNGTNGFRLIGAGPPGSAGSTVSPAGDVNGDGFDDLIVTAPFEGGYTAQRGHVYVVYGRSDGIGATVDLAALDGSSGFEMHGAQVSTNQTRAAAAAGDIDADGYDDIIIDASFSGFSHGVTYVVFGGPALEARMDLGALDAGRALILHGLPVGSPQSVAGAGDVDGDGFDDLLIGMPGVTDSGAVYVVHGRDFRDVGVVAGGAGADTLSGTPDADRLVGGGGDDTIDAAGGADNVVGGAGDDRLYFDYLDAGIDGGSGEDTVLPSILGQAIDLSGLAGRVLVDIERIDLTGMGANHLLFDVLDVLGLSSTSNRLVVTGDIGDAVQSMAQGWLLDAGGPVALGGNAYTSYHRGAAHLLVDVDVTQMLS
ncbi:MAG: hypothetical protein AB7Q97_25535 [Gammaproteobacteria bacterium]